MSDTPTCPSCNDAQAGAGVSDCKLLIAAYILAGLAMMLNIRLSYSSAPYALIRFRLPENLFSVFVRRMASALEFWCLPSMLLGNIIEIIQKVTAKKKSEFQLDHKQQQTAENEKLGKLIRMKHKKFWFIIFPSMLTMWSDFITYLILLIVYVTCGDHGNVTAYYFVIAVSGFIFGINMVLVYAADWRYTPVYIAGENAFPMLTSIIHYFATLIFGNRRKYNSDFLIVTIDIGIAITISFVTATLWTYSYTKEHDSDAKKFRFNVLPNLHFTPAYGTTEGNPKNAPNAVNLTKSGGDGFTSKATITVTRAQGNNTNLSTLNVTSVQSLTITVTGGTIKNSGNTLQKDTQLSKNTVLELIASGNITQPTISTDKDKAVKLKGTIVVTADGTLGNTLNFGGGSGVSGSLSLTDAGTIGDQYVTISGSLNISETAYNALNGTDKTADILKIGASTSTLRNPQHATGGAKEAGLNKEDSFTMYWHILPSDKYDQDDTPDLTVISPTLMVIIGMGFVYCIYPGIAPGMIVPFYLVDKIETVLLVLTTFPPVIIAILQKVNETKGWSPKTQHNGTRFGNWTSYNAFGKSYDTRFYHGFDLLMIIKMTLLVIFIYCLHYRDSNLSRSIVNQPKMSTFLTIVFYMCHECLLALGFSGVIGNNGATYVVLPAQYVGALLMIFLAFYSEGYIIEYKSHDPAHWPTEGMTKWNAFCYWCKTSSKITMHILRSLFKAPSFFDLIALHTVILNKLKNA